MIEAIINELQTQLRLLSNRAARLAGQLAMVTAEHDKLQKKLSKRDDG